MNVFQVRSHAAKFRILPFFSSTDLLTNDNDGAECAD